jgi:hypothetical protein
VSNTGFPKKATKEMLTESRGAPNGATLDGYGAMMEVQYVAVYQN